MFLWHGMVGARDWDREDSLDVVATIGPRHHQQHVLVEGLVVIFLFFLFFYVYVFCSHRVRSNWVRLLMASTMEEKASCHYLAI